jgi:hypothetical protein
MKRQDVSGENTLHTDGTGGAGTNVNVTGINGATPDTGLGVAGAGTLRVAISSDSPSTGNTAASATGAAVPANADYGGVNVGGTLRGATGVNPTGTVYAQQIDIASVNGVAAATVPVTVAAGSAVIGHVITDTGSTTAVTGNVTAVQATGSNLHTVVDSGVLTSVTAITNALPAGSNVIGHVIADTGSTTAVTGNVTVVQATGTNLHAVIDSGSTTAVTQATASNLNAQVVGSIASDSVDSGNPVKTGSLAKSADITAVADADRVDNIASLLGKQIGLPYATPALTWNYAAAAGGLVTTGGVTAKAAGTGSQRLYVTSVQAINSHATISTEVVIRDGASGTTLWRGWAQAAGGGCAAQFTPPLRGTAATLIEIAEITATATTGVLMNLQGYTAAE